MHHLGDFAPEAVQLCCLRLALTKLIHNGLEALQGGIRFLQFPTDFREARFLAPKLVGQRVVPHLEPSELHLDLASELVRLQAILVNALVKRVALQLLLVDEAVHLHGKAVDAPVHVVQSGLLLLEVVAVALDFLVHGLNLFVDAYLVGTALLVPATHLLLKARDGANLLHCLELPKLDLLDAPRVLGDHSLQAVDVIDGPRSPLHRRLDEVSDARAEPGFHLRRRQLQ
mmetsp:Transcript_91967/g.259831  ORF Transcript_91967/g.259831 Transcript_91967/m.259831 type:complete len:229 (+) Transcript_91967:1204-1890(+)